MASLTGQSISSTYDSLLKLTDNGPITSSFKEITDGLGNSSGVFVKSTGQIKLGNYTTTTSFTGTVVGYLAFTSAGEIITTAAASGGISSLNTLTASTQTFATGTSGTDFNISSATSTHTFNLPTASATNRGALSSTDWSTFNGKASLSSPAFTGTPTAPTAAVATDTTQLATTAFVQQERLTVFNRQTASYTLVLSDKFKVVEMNVASANNLTVPLNSSVAFPIGTEIQVLQYGAGQTTIVATVGVTLRSKSSQLKIGNQYTGVTLVKVGTNEWYVIGNVAA